MVAVSLVGAWAAFAAFRDEIDDADVDRPTAFVTPDTPATHDAALPDLAELRDCPARGRVDPYAEVLQLDDSVPQPPRAGSALPRRLAFLDAASDGCAPLRFDPCRPIRYVVVGTDVPSAVVDDVTRAVARVSDASGLEFVLEGVVARPPGNGVVQTVDGVRRWAPLTILVPGAADAPPQLSETRPIVGSSAPVAVGDVLVTATLSVHVDTVVDLDTGAALPAGFGPGVTRGRMLLHELGHAIGLGHVSSAEELMHEPLTDHPDIPARFGAGDRLGLALIGDELGCVDTPPVPPPSDHYGPLGLMPPDGPVPPDVAPGR